MAKKLRVRLEELLKEHKISLRELGRQTDITHKSLSRIKNHKNNYLFTEHLEKIADHFDIKDMNKLIEVVDEEEDDQ